MNQSFLQNLIERLEYYGTANVWSQREMRDWLILDGECMYNFPMICFEHTEDSNVEVHIDESKFLNDSAHMGTWIGWWNNDDLTCIINLREVKDTLEIDALEMHKYVRGEGFGREIVETIEESAKDYYKNVRISPFDTSAMNFWEHMGYQEGKMGYWIKAL